MSIDKTETPGPYYVVASLGLLFFIFILALGIKSIFYPPPTEPTTVLTSFLMDYKDMQFTLTTVKGHDWVSFQSGKIPTWPAEDTIPEITGGFLGLSAWQLAGWEYQLPDSKIRRITVSHGAGAWKHHPCLLVELASGEMKTIRNPKPEEYFPPGSEECNCVSVPD